MLSFSEDSWLQDRYESHTRWIATLSNGQIVYEDDDRPGISPRSAWIRLCAYCKENNLHVVNITLQFRSHRETAYSGDGDGVFFCKGIIGHWGGPTYQYY